MRRRPSMPPPRPRLGSLPPLTRVLREVDAYLAENGFAVVKSVLSPAECETALGLTWDFLEQVGSADGAGGIDRNDVRTWVRSLLLLLLLRLDCCASCCASCCA